MPTKPAASTKPPGPTKPAGPTADLPVGLADADTGELAVRLRFAVARLARVLRYQGQEEGDDVTASRLAALATIEKHGPITLGELAGLERVQPPSMTRIVARLEDQGLVARAVDPADRRVARLTVTPEGAELLTTTRVRRTAFLVHQIELLDADERAALEAAVPILERMLAVD